MKITQILIWAIIAIVAIVFRSVFLGTVPAGLHADEASFLLNTISIIQTGMDEDGRAYPLFLDSYIDPKPALYSYLQAPVVAAFGATTAVSRIPAVLFGLASMPLVYLIVKKLASAKIAFVFVLLLSISPWHIVVSRATQEVILSFFCTLLSIWCYLQLAENLKQKRWWFIGCLSAALVAMYVYHSAKVFIPALYMSWIGIDVLLARAGKKRWKLAQHRWQMAALGYVVGLVLVFIVVLSQTMTRFSAVGMLAHDGPQAVLNEQIVLATGHTPGVLIRVFYNKAVFYGVNFLETYWAHFNFDFLFGTAGQPTRYMIPHHGLFYLVEMLLIPIGLFFSLYRREMRKWGLYMLVWVLVSPIAAGLTYQEVPSTIRTFTLVVPLLVFAAYGVLLVTEVTPKYLRYGMFGMMILGYVWGISYFSQQFFIQQPLFQSWHRNVAEERLAQYLVEVPDEYASIKISSVRDVYAYVAIQNPELLPALQATSSKRKEEVYVLDRYEFSSFSCLPVPSIGDTEVLYIVAGNCDITPGFQKISDITRIDGTVMYQAVRLDPSYEIPDATP